MMLDVVVYLGPFYFSVSGRNTKIVEALLLESPWLDAWVLDRLHSLIDSP